MGSLRPVGLLLPSVELVSSAACVLCLAKRRLTCQRGNADVPFFYV